MLETRKISRRFGGFSIKEVSFRVEQGDYFALLGPSGAGKSLLLELLAGLQLPDSGQILLNGIDISREKIQKRPLGLVFQDLAIFPHMTVLANIGFSLKKGSRAKVLARGRVQELVSKLEIGHLLGRKPSTLSGGELQRVALARVLVHEPAILLLDEPLASLDVQLRDGILALLRRLNREGQTIIHVTHDYREALSLASHVAVMQQGQLIQQGTSQDVFSRPASPFVAHFTGHPNFFPARLTRSAANTLPIAVLDAGPGFVLKSTCPEGKGFLVIDPGKIMLLPLQDMLSPTCLHQGVITDIYPGAQGLVAEVDMGIPILLYIPHRQHGFHDLHQGLHCCLSIPEDALLFLPAS